VKHVEVRRLYRDSVRLMQISAALTAVPGVEQALIAMATEANLDLLAEMGLAAPPEATANDMLVGIVCADPSSLEAARARLDSELTAVLSSGSTPSVSPPRTVGTAIRQDGGTVALVSTPGRYAFVEAMDALDAGAHVMVFSDNVGLAEEVALKRVAVQRGLLVMGPDCGTAVIGGVGLGFANVVVPGPVGIVAASGTGAQHIMSLLSWAGVGVSHCLGVGGRDLSTQVGGLATHAALDLLDKDHATGLIVLVGKPPAPSVSSALQDHAARMRKPVVMATLGLGQPDLTTATEQVLARLDVPPPSWLVFGSPAAPSSPGRLRGLFSGGTLCTEAMAVASEILGPIGSNIPLRPEWTSADHTMLDLGADEFTLGRPHPMIDPGPRLARLAREAAEPRCRVILLDVVLGHGAHPDPSSALSTAIRATRSDVDVVVSLVGTRDDPQGVDAQAAALAEAGATVFVSNAQAARHAATLARGGAS
jgi:FdrA protein